MVYLLLFFILAATIIAFVVYWCTTRAIFFARGVMALSIALMLSHYGYEFVPDRGFLNYIAWALICFGVIHFLSMLPRVDISIRFFCTLVISLFATEFVINLIGCLVDPKFEMNLLFEIVNKVICVAMAVFGVFIRGKKLPSESSSHLAGRIVDRFLASVFYVISLIVICVSFHAFYQIPAFLLLVIVVGGLVGAFVADIFLAEKLLFGYTQPEETEIPR